MSIRKLTIELQRKAEEELNEDPARIQEDLQHIRDWLKKQPHLRIRKDDQTLIAFIRGCKYRLHQTKQKIDFFYTMRSLIPEYYDNRDPLLPEIQEILNANVIVPLPATEGSAGPRILTFRFTVSNSETMTLANLLKVYFMSIDALMKEDDNCIIGGMIILTDWHGFSSNYLKQINLAVVKNFVLTLQHTYPIRIKAIHYINVPSAIETLYNIAKPFLTEKIKKRLFFYNEANTRNVHKVIPRSILPEEFGGDYAIDELGVEWKKKLESYRQWFLDDMHYRSDEKLRPEECKFSSDLYGIEGSFRKLDID